MTTNPTTAEAADPGYGYLAARQASVSTAFADLDRALDAARTIDAKTDKLIRFALSVRARSENCVRSHRQGAVAAGATEADVAYVLALTMRQAAGAEEFWSHDILADMAPAEAETVDADLCSCCG